MPDEVREHLTRDKRTFLHPESIQTLQIPSSTMVLLLFSSPHSFFIGFRSGNCNGHSRSIFFPVTHFCVVFKVCFLIIFHWEDPNMAHYNISNRVSHFKKIYWLVFYRIKDAIYLNKKYRPATLKYSSIFYCTHGLLFISVFTKPTLSVCC